MQAEIANKNYISKKLTIRQKRGIKFFLISIPFILYIFAFHYVPLFGWIYALYDYMPYNGIALNNHKFVGLEHFMQIWIQSNDLIRVLKNTIIIGGLALLFSPAPIILAILLNEVRNSAFKRIIQTTTTFPNFISWIIVFGISSAFFSSTGLIPNLTRLMGGTPSDIGLLGDVGAVYAFQTVLGLWKGLGWGAIIYIAAIAGIDQELYDAVKIDGANRFQSIRYVTIPGIMPTFIVMFLLGVGNILGTNFDQQFIFNNALVNDNMETLDIYVYQQGIILNDYSYAIAFGIAKSFVSILLLSIANEMARRVRGTSIF
jgi:putative aldouronate transport system permease protein